MLGRNATPAAELAAAVLSYQLALDRYPSLRVDAFRELAPMLQAARIELGLSQVRVAEGAGTGRVAHSRWERGSQPPSRGPFRRWLKALTLIHEGEGGLTMVIPIPSSLLRDLRADPALIHTLSAAKLEQLVADRLAAMGYEVTRSGNTSARDGGIDLIAVPRDTALLQHLIACQVKQHSPPRKTGREAVDRLLSWHGGPFNLGLLVTNTEFTRDALWAAAREPARHFMRLRDFEDLAAWVSGAFSSGVNWKEIPDEICLAPGVTIQVPKVRSPGANRLPLIQPTSSDTDWP